MADFLNCQENLSFSWLFGWTAKETVYFLGWWVEPPRKHCIQFFFHKPPCKFHNFLWIIQTNKQISIIILELPPNCSYVSCAPYHSIHPIVITFIIECFYLFILIMQRTCVVHLSLFNPQLKFRTSIYFSIIRTPIRWFFLNFYKVMILYLVVFVCMLIAITWILYVLFFPPNRESKNMFCITIGNVTSDFLILWWT